LALAAFIGTRVGFAAAFLALATFIGTSVLLAAISVVATSIASLALAFADFLFDFLAFAAPLFDFLSSSMSRKSITFGCTHSTGTGAKPLCMLLPASAAACAGDDACESGVLSKGGGTGGRRANSWLSPTRVSLANVKLGSRLGWPGVMISGNGCCEVQWPLLGSITCSIIRSNIFDIKVTVVGSVGA
jgi:hypothetical protein